MIIDKNSPIPQYFQLQTWLMEQLEQKVFKPDDKIPTEAEVQKMTGLARATIRQAIQNLVNMGYLERKRRLGTFVIDRQKSKKKRTLIGVLVPDIRLGYSPELARGAGDEAARNQHSLLLCNSDSLFVKANFHADHLIEMGVSGVIFVPTAASDEKNKIIIDKFKRNNICVVLADRLIPDPEVDSVTSDNFEGAYNLTKYLIEKGHRKIAITLSTLFSTERLRLEGYKKALEDHNIPVDQTIIITDNIRFTEEVYRKFANELFKQKEKFTAIFAGHDRIAFVLAAAAKEMGINIPKDISIVGYDDLPFTATHPLSLTTMQQPIYEMGSESMKLLLARIHGNREEPQKTVLESKFIERTSVIPRIS